MTLTWLQEEVFLQATGAAHASEGASICTGDVASTIQARVSRDMAAADTPRAGTATSQASFLPHRLSQQSSDQLPGSFSNPQDRAEAAQDLPAADEAASPSSTSDSEGALLQPATPGRSCHSSPQHSQHGKAQLPDEGSGPDTKQGKPGRDAGLVDKPPQPASAFSVPLPEAAEGEQGLGHSVSKQAEGVPSKRPGQLRRSFIFLREMLRKRARIAGKLASRIQGLWQVGALCLPCCMCRYSTERLPVQPVHCWQ